MDRYIGQKLDNRYEILEIIGTGGMAVVYKARCHRLNRLVAIKILRDDLAHDEEFCRRFHEESQAVAMLSHPNIMAIYDVSKSAEREYIVMELIDGITLKQYMQKLATPLKWQAALHYIIQIMKALSHAHSRGIIHRDIKPQNIMVLRDGTAKVTDFGIARLTSSVQHTLTQEALGSVHYISPEQARGSHIDSRADIYSAGVVLYEMLTGRLPFEGDTPVSVAIQHISSIPLTPREIDSSIPEAIEAMTMKAMAPEVNTRFKSADEMLESLEAFRKNPNLVLSFTTDDIKNAAQVSDQPTQAISEEDRQKVLAASKVVATAGSAKELTDKPKKPENLSSDSAPDQELDDSHAQGGLSLPLALSAVFVFLLGIGLFLWVTFFSDILSPAPTSRTIPDLSGQILSEVLLNSDYTEHFDIREGDAISSSSIPVGTIISQTPDAHSLTKGDYPTILVNVSSGAATIEMPDITSLEYRDAMSQLSRLGLKNIDARQEISDDITVNYIIKSEPVSGALVTAAETVVLYISQGPEVKLVTMLPVEGMLLDAATKVITDDLNLNLGTVSYVDSDEPTDTVVKQNIAANEEITEGTIITLQVSKGPEEEILPEEVPELTPEVTATPVETPAVLETPEPTIAPEVTPEPTPVPVETPVIAATTSKSYSVSIPQDLGDTVQVQITVGSSVQFNSQVQANVKFISPFLSGSGTETVTVSFDGTQFSSEEVKFS